jgi:hypothetical protein
MTVLPPTGGPIICLSAAGLTRVAAATTHSYDFLEVISEYEPNLLR